MNVHVLSEMNWYQSSIEDALGSEMSWKIENKFPFALRNCVEDMRASVKFERMVSPARWDGAISKRVRFSLYNGFSLRVNIKYCVV